MRHAMSLALQGVRQDCHMTNAARRTRARLEHPELVQEDRLGIFRLLPEASDPQSP